MDKNHVLKLADFGFAGT
jgi:serine/threonine protein kinase